MNSQITTLSNGLRIITQERPQLETISLGIWVKTGSAYEDKSNNGISHFLEHMSFKGTTNRTSLQISEEIEDVGEEIYDINFEVDDNTEYVYIPGAFTNSVIADINLKNLKKVCNFNMLGHVYGLF